MELQVAGVREIERTKVSKERKIVSEEDGLKLKKLEIRENK